ncbi:MAG: hypothetical protein ICV63_03695 [Coleofasciculus sp. Co-bin14]|nr:hypothetical protein [Coleofasciculus sp. Co-bin14]
MLKTLFLIGIATILTDMAVNPKPDEKGIVAQKSFVSMSCPPRGWRQQAIASFNAQGELVSREEFGDNEPLQFLQTVV